MATGNFLGMTEVHRQEDGKFRAVQSNGTEKLFDLHEDAINWARGVHDSVPNKRTMVIEVAELANGKFQVKVDGTDRDTLDSLQEAKDYAYAIANRAANPEPVPEQYGGW